MIEALIAVTLLAASLGLIIALFGGGLWSAKNSRDYSRAILLAREKADEVLSGVEPGLDGEGGATGYDWETTSFPAGEVPEEVSDTDVYRVEMRVRWREGQKPREMVLYGLAAR